MRREMNLPSVLDYKLMLLFCIIHMKGIDTVKTLISQSSKYRIYTTGQVTSLLPVCAASVVDEDYGHKVNLVTGECSAGDSSNQEPGFIYFDKTDMIQRFLNEDPIADENYPIRVQGGFGYNTGATVTFKLTSGWQRESINFADTCEGEKEFLFHFLMDASGVETGCHYINHGDWTDGKVCNDDGNFPTGTEINLDFNFELSSIKVSKNGVTYLACPHKLDPAELVFICTYSGVAVTGLHFYTTMTT